MIFEKALRSFSYSEFLEYAAKEVVLNEEDPSRVEDPKYIHFGKLNLQRMKRWTKTYQVPEALLQQFLNLQQQEWWVITEAWCGDSAQNLPLIAALAEQLSIPLRIVLRDENPEIIDQYLTNGTKSIPVLVAFDKDKHQVFRWGPRPVAAQELMNDWKADPRDRDFEAFELEMHQWYTQNKGKDLEQELLKIINSK
ncbi:MAG TPA: thioredoxin family protein [Edaphocola sp.]|nr:thioredoxin family protein [Edaphocola sp.]